jgi:hypothetical protein
MVCSLITGGISAVLGAPPDALYIGDEMSYGISEERSGFGMKLGLCIPPFEEEDPMPLPPAVVLPRLAELVTLYFVFS